jgi:hypothetical protein
MPVFMNDIRSALSSAHTGHFYLNEKHPEYLLTLLTFSTELDDSGYEPVYKSAEQLTSSQIMQLRLRYKGIREPIVYGYRLLIWSPIKPERPPLPTYHGLRLDDDEGISPTWLELR